MKNGYSIYSEEIFKTPDICIIKKDAVNETTEYYGTKRRFCFVKNNDLMTFCEVKQFNPFPELLFKFIGVVNELRNDILTNTAMQEKPLHIAPSLMILGTPNQQSLKIKEELEKRYCINIIFDIFRSRWSIFSKRHIDKLKVTGNNATEIDNNKKLWYFRLSDNGISNHFVFTVLLLCNDC